MGELAWWGLYGRSPWATSKIPSIATSLHPPGYTATDNTTETTSSTSIRSALRTAALIGTM